MTTLALFAGAFVCGFALDVLAAAYMRAVADRRALRAALLSAAIGGMGLIAVLIVVDTPITVVADILGSFFGAYVAVRRS